MHVRIISPEESVFDGDADTVVAPAFDGQIGILPRHAPLMTLLGEGTLTLKTGGGEQVFDVRGGFLQVVSDTVSVVAEHARTRDKGAK
jgi:F-type H+-transporting ATPase subunit epsilon